MPIFQATSSCKPMPFVPFGHRAWSSRLEDPFSSVRMRQQPSKMINKIKINLRINVYEVINNIHLTLVFIMKDNSETVR
jgi:hypothetical protein